MAFIDPDTSGFVDPDEDSVAGSIGSYLGRATKAIPGGFEAAATLVPRGILGLAEGVGGAFFDIVAPTGRTLPQRLDRAADTFKERISDRMVENYFTKSGKEVAEMVGSGFEWTRDKISDGAALMAKYGPSLSMPGSIGSKLNELSDEQKEMLFRFAAEFGVDAATVGLIPTIGRGIKSGKGRIKPTAEELEAGRVAFGKKEPTWETAPEQFNPDQITEYTPQVSPESVKYTPDPFAEYGVNPKAGESLSLAPQESLPGRPETPFRPEPSVLETTPPEVPAVFRRRGEEGGLRPETPPMEPDLNMPLRQEVLDSPEMRKTLDDYQRWIEDAKREGRFEDANELARNFKEIAKQQRLEYTGDASRRALYEQTETNSLLGERGYPLEKTTKPDLSAPKGVNPIIDPDTLRVGGKFAPRPNKAELKQLGEIQKSTPWNKQRGVIDPDVLLKSIGKLTGILPRTIESAREQLERGISQAMDRRDITTRAVFQKKLDELNGVESNGQLNLNFKSQKGSFGFNDPEFNHFRAALPKPMRKNAKAIYKELLKERDAEARNVEVVPNENARIAVSNVPGLDKAIEGAAPIYTKPWEELRTGVLEEPNLNLTGVGKMLTPGAQLTAFWKNNTALRYSAQTINNAVQNAYILKKQWISDKNTGLISRLRATPKNEYVRLHAELVLDEGKGLLTRDKLVADGYSDKAIAFWEKRKTALDEGWKILNDTRKMLGYKPIPKREGYDPFRRVGDWQIEGWDGDKIVWKTGASTRGQAKKIEKYLKERNPDLKFKQEYNPIRIDRAEAMERSMSDLTDLMDSDDPRVQAIESAYGEFLEKQAFDNRMFKKHFMPKRKPGDTLKGGEGNKEWLGAQKNAEQGFKSTFQYLENLADWSELQKADKSLNKMFTDQEFKEKQPTTWKYAKYHWYLASGRGTRITRAIDSIVDAIGETTGLGRTNISDFAREMKTLLTMKVLISGGFLGTQVYQPHQFMHHWMRYMKEQGAEANLIKVNVLAGRDFINNWAGRNVTDVGKQALAWADRNYYFDSHIMDDIRSTLAKKYLGAAEDIAKWPLAKAESVARAYTYTHYVHFLNEAGMKPGREMFETAKNLVDMSMTDYRVHERPALYQMMGVVGDLMSSLTTFKHNQYGQLAAFVSKGKQAPWALSTMVVEQLIAGGIMGFYGRDEVDSLIDKINQWSAENNWFDQYIPNTKQIMLKEDLGDLIFGGVSAITGMDMSSKLGAADVLPNGILDFFFPLYNEPKNMATDLFEFLMDMNSKKALKASHSWTPSGFKAIPEALSEENGVVQDPRTDTGKTRRNSGDWFARGMGVYSLDESRERMAQQELRKENQWVKTRNSTLLERARNVDLTPAEIDLLIHNKIPSKLSKYVTQYAKLNGGDVLTIINDIREHQKKKGQTGLEQEMGMPSGRDLGPYLRYNRGKRYNVK